MYAVLLNTTGSDYNSIIEAQTIAFNLEYWSNYQSRLKLDWTQAIARVFWEMPTWTTVLQWFETPESIISFINANTSEWWEIPNP